MAPLWSQLLAQKVFSAMCQVHTGIMSFMFTFQKNNKTPRTGMTLHRQETNIILLNYGRMALRKTCVRLGKQLGAKYIPGKHEDPSLSSSTQEKTWAWQQEGEAGQRQTDLGAHWPSSLAEMVLRETLSQNKRWRGG